MVTKGGAARWATFKLNASRYSIGQTWETLTREYYGYRCQLPEPIQSAWNPNVGVAPGAAPPFHAGDSGGED